MDVLSASPSRPRDMLVWKHAAASLRAGIPTALLCVVRSEGSSPGRQGFKMSVTPTGLAGSIGGGIMEHKLVELMRARLRDGEYTPEIRRQVHRAHARTDRSGMICSGEQEILLLPLLPEFLPSMEACKRALRQSGAFRWIVTAAGPRVVTDSDPAAPLSRYQPGATWQYEEKLGFRDHLTIVGGGHVGLALSRVLSTLDFEITVLDDRPALNTHLLNPYAHHKRTVRYEQLAQEVPQGPHQYVVIMTVGYRTDAIALRQLLHHKVRYLGVLGSSSKITHLLQELRTATTADEAALHRVHAPIGLPIHSRTPEEIAVSIAAELIRVRNEVTGDEVNSDR